jgi:L-ascorbate metabolism protein UlaG (beta-lactamase superfamily)
MGIDITFLGHAGFLLSDGTTTVAIDPFLTGNPVAVTEPKDVRCQAVVLTHGHGDHLGDTVTIAKANEATVFGAFEIYEYMSEQGITAEPGNPGGKIDADWGWVAFTQAFHSSSYNGRYLGMPCGAIVHLGGVTVYHLGDTTIFGDMKLLGEFYKPDIALVPVGDRFTMGPELATMSAELIKPKVAVPMHYGTFPIIRQDATGFTPKGMEVKELKPGETWRYN